MRQAHGQVKGTGSAGIAFSHGFPDDEHIPREVILRATREETGPMVAVWFNQPNTGGGAHSDVYRAVHGRISWEAITKLASPGSEEETFLALVTAYARIYDLEEPLTTPRGVALANTATERIFSFFITRAR